MISNLSSITGRNRGKKNSKKKKIFKSKNAKFSDCCGRFYQHSRSQQTFLIKAPKGKYFHLCGPHSLCGCSLEPDERPWLCATENLLIERSTGWIWPSGYTLPNTVIMGKRIMTHDQPQDFKCFIKTQFLHIHS